MNMPIWLPTVESIESRSASGSRISRLKNSMTLSTSPRSRTGKPNAAWRPSRAAMPARGKFASCTTSGIHAGSPLAQTRPGRPMPRLNVAAAARLVELGEPQQRGVPDLGAAERVSLAVDRPERAVLPSERLADRLEDFRGRFVYGRRVEERARRDILGG